MVDQTIFDWIVGEIREGNIQSKDIPCAIANHTGWSIAHVAAVHNILPEDFNNWHLIDNQGVTVADVVIIMETYPKYLFIEGTYDLL